MASLALAFDILARDRASKTFDKVGDSAERAGKRGKGFGTALKAGVGMAAGALAAVGLSDLIGSATAAISDSIGEAREAQKVGRTTSAIIKATGGAAKISADQVGDLAARISEKAGVDDEAIQSGANLLLTFKQVRNEVGKGNDVFNRATQAAVDLSAAGFGSVDSASKMLGKALNDPLKGISALSRAGVTFTAGQKAQIKTLVESGQTLKAQKLILKEVESQVGGVAAANASMGDKVKVAIGNIKESVGTALLPVLDKLGAWFIDKGLPAIRRFGGWLSGKLWPALQQGYRTILPGVKQALAILTGGVDGGTVSWKKIGEVITTKVIPFLSLLARVYLPVVARNIRNVIDIVRIAWQTFITFRDIIARVLSTVIGKVAGLMDMWASMLRALGRVPGFGWAKDAAEKMQNAADKARGIARAIGEIPSSKTITITTVHQQMTRVITAGNAHGNIPKFAGGVRDFGGGLAIVGERGPELVQLPRGTNVYSNSDSQRMVGNAGTVAAGGKTDLSEASLQRLAAILSDVRTQPPIISAGSFDRAMGGVLR